MYVPNWMGGEICAPENKHTRAGTNILAVIQLSGRSVCLYTSLTKLVSYNNLDTGSKFVYKQNSCIIILVLPDCPHGAVGSQTEACYRDETAISSNSNALY